MAMSLRERAEYSARRPKDFRRLSELEKTSSWTDRTLQNLEAAFSCDTHRHRLTSIVRRCVTGELVDLIAARVLEEVGHALNQHHMLVSRKSEPGYRVWSLSTASDDWKERMAGWLMGVLGDDLAELIAAATSRKASKPKREASR